MILLFEHLLEIGLIAKTEIIADFRQTFIGIGQKALCFFQLTAHDKGAHIDT